jgi:hypothetical protein
LKQARPEFAHEAFSHFEGIKQMKSLLLAAALAVLFGCAAEAQTYQDSGGTIVPGFVPIQPGVGPLFTGSNPGHITGSFSATLSGFTPGGSYTGISSVTTSGQDVQLPSGTAVAVYNIGSSAACVKLGTTSSVSASCSPGSTPSSTGGDVVPPGGSCGFVVGSNAYLGAITSSGTAQLVLSGGSGLTTNACSAGGGGGGSSGVAQGSTTSGQTGSLIQGAVTTSTPSYTTAQTSPLSLDTSGNLRVNIQASASTATTGSAVPSNTGYIGANSSGNLVGVIQADHSAAINISNTTPVAIVAAVSGKKIYVTGWDVISAGSANFYLEYGTQTTNPCDTGTTSLTGPYNLAAQAGVARSGNLGPIYVIPAGNQLCGVDSGTVQMSGSVSYTQF